MESLKERRLELDGDDLWWSADGNRQRVDSLIRCFPTSSPERWISVRTENGDELALIRSLDDLDAESRGVAEPILRDRYYVPTISQILSIEGSLTGKFIRAQTDDGPVELDVNIEADVDFREYPRVVIDEKMLRRKFVIEDADEMDKPSRELIRRHLRRSRGRRGGRGFR